TRAVPCVLDHLACGGVDGLAWHTRPGRGERRLLRGELDVEHPLPLVGRTSEHERPADIRAVALPTAATVDEQDRALPDRLWRARAVRQRRVLADLHARAAREPELTVGGSDQVPEALLRHPLFQRSPGSLIRLQCHL